MSLSQHPPCAPSPDPIEIARRFADALDRDDFASATALLGADCSYEVGLATLVGPQAIGASYRDASAWGHATLDSLAYESQVEAVAANEVSILFVDHITHRGKRHTYSCKQLLRIGTHGVIERIRHVELPGQREALVGFLASVGLARP